MDMTVKCERIAVDDRESLKDDKASSNSNPCGNNNILKGETIPSLEAEFEVRLKIKPSINGSVNGLDEDSDHNISEKTENVEDVKNIPAQETNNRNNETSECSKTDSGTSESIQIKYVAYESELQMPDIMRLIQKDLSEPYSIYTYRYFIHNWPKLCYLAMHDDLCVGAIVCKLDFHRKMTKRGYIAMLAVDEKYRKQKIGSKLVRLAIQGMVNDKADEVVLETEITNQPALRLYENLGFVRDKRLFRYYLNGVDALRLKLWLR